MPLAALAVALVAALAGVGFATAGTAASPPQVVMPTTTPMSAEDAAGLQSRMETLKLVGGDDIPGVLVGVWDPVKGYYKGGVGVADRQASGRPRRPTRSGWGA